MFKKENQDYFKYKEQILSMKILGYLCIRLDHPDEKGSLSLPLCTVVSPLSDSLGLFTFLPKFRGHSTGLGIMPVAD